MKVIGISSSGNSIIELDAASRAQLIEAGKTLMAIGQDDTYGGPTYLPMPAAPVAAKPARAARPAKPAGKGEVEKTCDQCGGSFVDHTRCHNATTCPKKACQIEHKRQYQRDWWARHRKGKKAAAATPAPVSKEERLGMIRAAAGRLQETDPIERAGRMAAQIRAEEG